MTIQRMDNVLIVVDDLEDKREQVLDATTGNFTHLDDVIETKAKKVKMLRQPEQLVFVSAP